MQAEKDIFISYSKADMAIVSRIVKEIGSRGIECWFQLNDSSQDFTMKIRKAIKSCRAFVVFLSHASIASDYVNGEITLAFEHRKAEHDYKILPVYLDDCQEDDEFDNVDIRLCKLNALQLDDYSTTEALVNKIVDQLEIAIGENAVSMYSTSMEEEVERLAIQNAFYNRYASTYIDEAFSELSDVCALDVGCSDGTNTVKRLTRDKCTHVLGVDKDESKVENANESYGDETFAFRYADISDESFEDVLKEYLASVGRDYFDFIHVSAVFLHINTHLLTMKILYKYLAPGGYIFIIDEDDGLNEVFPDTSFYQDCFYIWDKSRESGDRHMGRKIPLLLKEVGFPRVEVRRTTISSEDFGGEMKEVLWDLYFNPYFWTVPTPEYFYDPRAYAKIAPYTAAHDENKRQYMDGKVFIMLGVMFFLAKK